MLQGRKLRSVSRLASRRTASYVLAWHDENVQLDLDVSLCTLAPDTHIDTNICAKIAAPLLFLVLLQILLWSPGSKLSHGSLRISKHKNDLVGEWVYYGVRALGSL